MLIGLMISSLMLPGVIASEVVPTIPNMIKAAEIKYELPEGLLQALAHVESSGNPKALNKDDGTKEHKTKGIKVKSYGLLQIQLTTAQTIQKIMAKRNGFKINKKNSVKSKDLMNPETNIEYGAFYLKWLLNEYDGDVSLTLSCFNAGLNSHICKNKKYNGEYVGKILNAWIAKRE